ncbi:hypothetical protein DERP_015274 [Dermatophagoides pteronyssinus]|uniref:Secreted protein n=1 Tax=Dermatophagoides pteronyssinus TaxID=6956 RepID=A0ABQ8J3M9_DERPT|nr:hypothetical protein DERP_015274 [Dermatophagoides pteronyssinus]
MISSAYMTSVRCCTFSTVVTFLSTFEAQSVRHDKLSTLIHCQLTFVCCVITVLEETSVWIGGHPTVTRLRTVDHSLSLPHDIWIRVHSCNSIRTRLRCDDDEFRLFSTLQT